MSKMEVMYVCNVTIYILYHLNIKLNWQTRGGDAHSNMKTSLKKTCSRLPDMTFYLKLAIGLFS